MFTGSFVAIVTPFKEEGRHVDVEALSALVSWQCEEGTDGIVCLGTTGESATLSDAEQNEVIETALTAAQGRTQVIVGTGSNDTRHALEKTLHAKRLGADGCLVVTPYYNRPTADGCIAHFREIAKAKLPMILYHHPGRCGIKLSAKTLGQICTIDEVVAVKESSGDLELTQELLGYSQKPILAGDDALLLPYMAVGAQGLISVLANILPKSVKELVDLCLQGQFFEAREKMRPLLPLIRSLFVETNPQGVKYALSLLGKASSELRLPLLEPKEETKRLIAGEIKNYFTPQKRLYAVKL